MAEQIAGKAQQGAMVILAVIGNATPPVAPTGAARKWKIGSARLVTGRKV